MFTIAIKVVENVDKVRVLKTNLTIKQLYWQQFSVMTA